jgi:hypothetical protein
MEGDDEEKDDLGDELANHTPPPTQCQVQQLQKERANKWS